MTARWEFGAGTLILYANLLVYRSNNVTTPNCLFCKPEELCPPAKKALLLPMLFPFQLIQFLNKYKIHLADSPETPSPDSVKTSKKEKKRG